MEKNSPSKPSVAELAGRFKGHIIPTPTSNDESPFYRRPPSSLKLQNQKDDNEESVKTNASSKPFKMKMKNSPIIEKLQANLALSPTALLPSPKTSEVKLQPAPLSPTTPCSPQSPLGPTLRPQQSIEEEDPVSFDSPPEGAPLPSFNKTRARLSFKRRPPTRQHRRSAGEEAGAFGSGLSPSELYSPKENGDGDLVLDSPAEEAEHSQAEERDRDCEKTKEDVAKDDPDNREDLEEQAAEQALTSERQPSEPCPAEQTEGDFQREENQEEMPRPTKEEIKGCEL